MLVLLVLLVLLVVMAVVVAHRHISVRLSKLYDGSRRGQAVRLG